MVFQVERVVDKGMWPVGWFRSRVFEQELQGIGVVRFEY